MKVIAITGRAGSGKDTAARCIQVLTGQVDPYYSVSGLIDLHPFLNIEWQNGLQLPEHITDWPVLKFAYPVYQIAAIIVGREVDDIMADPKFKNQIQLYGLTGRELLQKIGTECFREVLSTDIWIQVMDRKLKQLESAGLTGVIISDLRFVNECHFLEEMWRATIVKMVGRESGVPITHQSESELDSISGIHHIHNTGSYTGLMNILSDFCKHLNIHNCKYTWK